jgi:hypothetical protein
MASLNLTMVVCGSVGLATEVADTVDGSGAFFFPNQFISNCASVCWYWELGQISRIERIDPDANKGGRDEGRRVSQRPRASLVVVRRHSLRP